MAKLAVTVTFLFVLFAVSHARIPLDQTENDVTNSESDFKATTNTILLPSEKPESEPATVVELEVEPQPETKPEIHVDPSEATTELMPLTVISFRPINRQFPRRPYFPFRHRHGCLHGRRFNQGGPRFHHNREFNLGNDMMTSDREGKEMGSSNGPLFHGGPRQMPARWARFHHQGHGDSEELEMKSPHYYHHHGAGRFPFKNHDDDDDVEMNRPHHYFRHRHAEGEENEEHEHHGRRQEEGGFMRGIRKFLNQF